MHARIARVAAAAAVAAGLLLVGACTDKSEDATPATPAAAATFAGDADGARTLVERVGQVADTALVTSLRPTTADYQALFEPDYAAIAERFYAAGIWGPSLGPVEAMAKPGQTEIHIWSATTDDLRAWTEAARANFPGGYERIRDRWKPGLAIYAWEYVVPGEEHGMAYNGLVYVNGHWAWTPKPWYPLERSE